MRSKSYWGNIMKSNFNKIISILAVSALPAFAVADNAFSGFQVGATMGHEEASMDWEADSFLAPVLPPVTISPTGDDSESLDDSAFAYGVFGGYNFAINEKWIIGAELAFQDSDISDSLDSIPGLGPNNTSAKVQVNASYLLGVKGGYLINESLMAYSTLSATLTEVESSSTCPSDGSLCNPGSPAKSSKDDDDITGWALALGVEKSLTDNLSVRAEYRYAELGTAELTAIDMEPGESLGADVDVEVESQTFVLGAAYKF